jgi:hypothetical protein
LRGVGCLQPVAVLLFEGMTLLIAEVTGQERGLACALHSEKSDTHLGPGRHPSSKATACGFVKPRAPHF